MKSEVLESSTLTGYSFKVKRRRSSATQDREKGNKRLVLECGASCTNAPMVSRDTTDLRKNEKKPLSGVRKKRNS